MGPVRGGVIAAGLALGAPTVAWSDVCAKVRPFVGTGETGTALTEAISLIGTPPSLVLIVLTALAIRFRWQWAALGVVVLWSVWVSLIAMSAPDATMLAAIDEGCVGSPTLFIAVVAAICGGMMLYMAPRKANQTDGES